MTTENTTPNRSYQLPFQSNELRDDVLRLISALSAIDVDVAGILVAVADRALLVHQHTVADTTGLQAALDSKQDASAKGNANGFAALDATGKVPAGQLPSALFGSLSYQGTWNANTNTPTIPASSAANKGQYYKVSADGATNVSGITDWKVGDWIVSNGTAWDKIDNTDQVASVAGLQGVISAAALKTALAIAIADVAGLQTALDAKQDARASIGAAVGALTADANTATANGWWRCNATSANIPTASDYLIETVAHIEALWVTQTAHLFTAAGAANTWAYRRHRQNGTWGAWYKLQLSQAEQDARYLTPAAAAAAYQSLTASRLTSSALISFSTGATVYDITGIPSWVKQITIGWFNALLSADEFIVQIGSAAGGVLTSGYLGAATSLSGSILQTSTRTNGLSTRGGQIAGGVSELVRSTGNYWAMKHNGATNGANSSNGGSSIDLGANVLDRIRLTSGSGTATGTSGFAIVHWE